MKIHEYREMMRHLTRKPVSRDLMQAASVEEPVAMAEGGMVERQGYWKGSSLEKFLPRIKHLYVKENKSVLEIAKDLFGNTDRKTTVESAVNSMIDPKMDTPINITKEELSKRKSPLGANQFKKLPYAKDSEISKRIKDAAKKGEESITEFLENNKDLNKTSVYKFLNEQNITFKKIDQGGLAYQEEVTDRIKDLQKIIEKNPDASARAIREKFSKLYSYKQYDSTVSRLKDAFENGRPNFTPSSKIKDKVLSLKSDVPSTFEEALVEAAKKYDIDPKLITDEIKTKIKRSRVALQEFFDETNFEHNFAKQLLKYIEDPKKRFELLMTGSRTTPELNQFKRRYDNLLKGAVSRYERGEITRSQYNKEVEDIAKEVKDITGGYEIGYIKFDKDGKAVAVVKQDPFYEGSKVAGPESSQRASAFENTKYHNNLIKNYKKNPDAESFNSLRGYIAPEDTSFLKTEAQAWEKAKKYWKGTEESFLNWARKNTDNPVVQSIFKRPWGKGALVTSGVVTGTALQAEEPEDPVLGEKIKEEYNKYYNQQNQPQTFETYTDFDEGKDTQPSLTETIWDVIKDPAAVGTGMAIGEGATNIAGKAMAGKPITPTAMKELKLFVPKAAQRGLYAYWTPTTSLIDFADLKALLSSPEERKAHFSRYIDPEQGTGARLGKEISLAFAPSMVRAAGQLAGHYGSTVANPKGLERLMTRGFLERALNLGMSVPTALRVARLASPIGWASLAGELGYDFYKQYQENKKQLELIDQDESLSPEQKQRMKNFITGSADPITEEQRNEIESMGYQGAKDGGRIGFQDGSDGEESIPLLDESNIKKEEYGLRGLYYNINAAGPSTVGYADDKFNVSASKNLRPGPMEDKGMTYKLDIRPNDDGTFSIVKTPYTKSIGYTKGDEDFNYGISAIQTPMGPQFQAGLNLKFASGGRVGFADGPEDPNKLLPIDPLLQDNALQDPGRRDVLKFGAAGAGILGLGKLGLLKLGKTPPPVEAPAVTTTMGPETPEIIKALYTTILKQGKKTVENKIIKPSVPEGEPVTTYNYNNYQVAENSEGITIFRTIDNGDFGYRQEVFQLRKDPKTGKMVFEDITVRPDYEGKLKDIEYGVEPESYGEIGNFLANVNKNDKFIGIAEKDIKKMLPEE